MEKKKIQVWVALTLLALFIGCKNSSVISNSEVTDNLVSIHGKNGTSCYGVKIGSDRILTAAHCVVFMDGDFNLMNGTDLYRPRSIDFHSQFFSKFSLGFFNCLKRLSCSEADFLKELFKVGLPDFAIIRTFEKFPTWLELAQVNFSLPLLYFSNTAKAIIEVRTFFVTEPLSLLSYSLISPICKGSSGLPLLQYKESLKVVGLASMGLSGCKIFSPSVFSLVDNEVKALSQY